MGHGVHALMPLEVERGKRLHRPRRAVAQLGLAEDRGAELEEIVGGRDGHQEPPAGSKDAGELAGIHPGGDRGDGGERAVGVRQEAIRIRHDEVRVAMAARRGVDGRDGDVDAVTLRLTGVHDRAEVVAFAAAGIEHGVAGGEREEVDHGAHERRGKPAIEEAPAGGDGFGAVAGLRRAAVLRLEEVDVAAARHVEGMAARADEAPLLGGQRRAASAHGAEHCDGHRSNIYHVQRSQKRLLVLFLALSLSLVVAALLYQAGMARLEGKSRTFWDSLEWAAETLSTTGYGADSRWSHPLMIIFIVLVQLAGVLLFFLVIPIFLVPFLEERFEERLPRRADEKLSHHVIVYRFGPAVETLLQRLRGGDVPSLVVEIDEAQARVVAEMAQPVVFSRSEEDALDVCRLDAARAIVANGRDQENAALILRARQMGFRGEIYAFVEEPAHRKPMELAGATAAYTPRHIIAAALAAHASEVISPRLPGIDQIDGLERREMRVPQGSPLVGKTLRDAGLPVAVIGIWQRSRLNAQLRPETPIDAGAVLEVVGEGAALDRAAAMIGGRYLRRVGPFIVAGFGEVGRKVHELLTDAGEAVRVVERQPGERVDVVGDVLDSSVLERAGLADSRGLILALDSDDSTLFATVIARDTADDVPVIARVNHARNLDNIHRAGADYALSISDISGEMLSARLLGRSMRARDEHRRAVRLPRAEYDGVAPVLASAGDDALWVCLSG